MKSDFNTCQYIVYNILACAIEQALCKSSLFLKVSLRKENHERDDGDSEIFTILTFEVVQKCQFIEAIENIREERRQVNDFWLKLTEVICKSFGGELNISVTESEVSVSASIRVGTIH